MTLLEEGAENPRGQALVDELLWIHSVIRFNLATIASVVEQINDGAPVEEVRAQIDELASTSVVWTLRVNCMRYCSLVHQHHSLEDIALFPGLRRANPALHSIIDKLEADHVAVSGHLDAVEAAADRIIADESARRELADALRALADHLLAHLDYEEANITPTLRRMTGWPRD